MHVRTIILILAGTISLAACGDTLGDQAIGGAAIGAGVSAITDGNIATGAAVGAAGNVAYCQTYPHKCS